MVKRPFDCFFFLRSGAGVGRCAGHDQHGQQGERCRRRAAGGPPDALVDVQGGLGVAGRGGVAALLLVGRLRPFLGDVGRLHLPQRGPGESGQRHSSIEMEIQGKVWSTKDRDIRFLSFLFLEIDERQSHFVVQRKSLFFQSNRNRNVALSKKLPVGKVML